MTCRVTLRGISRLIVGATVAGGIAFMAGVPSAAAQARADDAPHRQPSSGLLRYHWVVAGLVADSSAVIRRVTTQGDTLVLDATPLLTLHDVDSIVATAQDHGEMTVGAVVRYDARAALRAATAQRLGAHLAVVVDERILTVGELRSALGTVLPVVTLDAPAEALALTARLNAARSRAR